MGKGTFLLCLDCSSQGWLVQTNPRTTSLKHLPSSIRAGTPSDHSGATWRRRDFPGAQTPPEQEHCLDKDSKLLSPTDGETMPSFQQGGA